MDKVAQYPSFLQPYIPALFFHPNDPQARLLFSILLKSAGESGSMLKELDKKLLMIQRRSQRLGFSIARHGDSKTFCNNNFGGEELDILQLFKKRATLSSDHSVVIGQSFAALAKNIVKLCPQ